MSRIVEKSGFFFAGMLVAIIGVLVMGASYQATNRSDRTIDYDPLMGGIGGMFTVTDPDSGLAYLYLLPPGWEQSDKTKLPPSPRLFATINKASAGNDQLVAAFRDVQNQPEK